MANAYIREYARLSGAENGTPQAPMEPAVTSQTVSFNTSAQSAALNDRTNLVWVRVDAAANMAVGANPTAAATDYPQLQADTDYFFGVKPGDKIAFYDGTS